MHTVCLIIIADLLKGNIDTLIKSNYAFVDNWATNV